MRIDFVPPQPPAAGTLVVLATADGRLGRHATALDDATEGHVARAISGVGESFARGHVLELLYPRGLEIERLVVLGLGEPGKAKAFDLESLGGTLAIRLKALGVESATVVMDQIDGLAFEPGELAVLLATGARLRSYRFDRYRTEKDDDEKDAKALAALSFQLADPTLIAAAWGEAEAVIGGVDHGRDLVSEPANVLSPRAFADACRELGGAVGLEVEILEPAKLRELGMNAFLAVGQGSVREPAVAVLQWRGGDPADAPVALVGKGVCFDSGGISLKPAGGMEEMKWDMGGAGAVFGALKALAGRKAKANVVGVLGLTENMPSGTAQRPGDVVTAMSGLSIEVVNTDAEGRLVLADVLHYTHTRFEPRAMIDLATLTGAIIVALGHEQAGLFSPDDQLAAWIDEAGAEVGERVWRMPLGEPYAKHIRSEIADIKNVGKAREAGATAGAVFLQRFAGEVPWAHIDIAGVAWSKQDLPLAPKGATGFGVRLLDRLIARHYEG